MKNINFLVSLLCTLFIGNNLIAQTTKGITIQTKVPITTSYSPNNNSVSVDPKANLIITFDKDVQKGSGDIVIKKSSDDSIVETIDVTSANVIAKNSSVSINPTSDLPQLTKCLLEHLKT